MSNQPYPSDPRLQPNYQQTPPVNQVPYDGPQYAEAANNTVQSSNVGGAYVQRQRESYVDPTGNRIESQAEVFEDKNQSRANIRYWVSTVTYFILGVLEIIMALRFVFRLLGANTDNGFITFLYNLSHFFVAPFNGVFNDQTLGHSTFEISTVVAMLVYALIAWGIVSLARVIFAPNLSGRQSFTSTRRRSLP